MRPQRTIKRPVTLEGKGIHTGRDVKVIIKSAPPDTGIRFIRTDLNNRPSITADVSNLSNYSNKLRCTSLGKDKAAVHTAEHLLAALNGLNIDNADIEIDNIEPPMLDGSSLAYAAEIQKAGSAEQDKKRRELCIKEAVWEKGDNALLIAIPSDRFKISYTLNYDDPDFPAQYVEFSLDAGKKKEEIFLKEIAPARTYCLEKEVALIMALGLGKGADYKTALVIKNGRPVKNEFRLKDEPARHKVLDLLGDLSLLNTEIKAHVIGIKSGHALNAEFVKKLSKLT
ncbi:MAG: UDP-3-O-acyl-N-acetylglucosamine deacetylase [Candidatus Omnitrophota bacterium]|nr:UDP-3-O-acyl-N-acetylglucosamine deacetylase [Candidatus Omnitrophota bacterium]